MHKTTKRSCVMPTYIAVDNDKIATSDERKINGADQKITAEQSNMEYSGFGYTYLRTYYVGI